MKEKVDRRILKTKYEIRKVFLTLLEEKEFQTITVEELSRKANIHRKTFYLHYANTADLLQEYEKEILDQINSLLASEEVFFREISRIGRNSFFLARCEETVIDLLNTHREDDKFMSEIEVAYCLKYTAAGIIAVYMDWLREDEAMSLSELGVIISRMMSKSLNIKGC